MPYTRTTLADLQALMAERWDQVVFWSAEEARLALNETLRDWNLLTGRWRRRLTLSSAAATPEIDLTATMTYGMRVTLSSGVPLQPSSYLELDLGRPTWRQETTASGGAVPTVPTIWAPLSLTRLAIWPSTAAAGVSNILVDGVSATPVLVDAADWVDIGEETIDYLVDMALHVAAFKEAGSRWRATLPYYQAFLQAAAEENGLLKTNQAYRRWAGLEWRRGLQGSKASPAETLDLRKKFSTEGA